MTTFTLAVTYLWLVKNLQLKESTAQANENVVGQISFADIRGKWLQRAWKNFSQKNFGTDCSFHILGTSSHCSELYCRHQIIEERKRHINLRNPWNTGWVSLDTWRDKQGLLAGVPGISCCLLGGTNRSLPAGGTPGRPGGFQKSYVIFSYVPFLLPNSCGFGECFQKFVSVILLSLLRYRLCLEVIIVSSDFQALVFLQDKLLESSWKP